MKKTLHNLLKNIATVTPKLDREITGFTIDSRDVEPGYLFVAYPGIAQDGRNYIKAAIENGAVAVICEATGFEGGDYGDVPVFEVTDLYKQVGNIAAKFYDYPSQKMMVIGITGTNGKTSCSHFLADAMQKNQILCGIVGTLGIGFLGNLVYGIHTTPDAINLQKQLYLLEQQGAKAIAMEVSSHGLAQERVAGVDFNIAVFTNLTQDHLDYHGDMAGYGAAKKSLFHRPELQHAVINVDDEFGRQLLDDIEGVNVIGYSTQDANIDIPLVKACNIKANENGFVAEVITPWGDGILNSKLLGRFNISNLLAVLAVLGVMEIPLQDALQALAELETIPGRMEALGGGKHPLVVVDFSHTPDALEKALIGLKEHCHGALWCVFGCGGGRDRAKRPLMGEIAEHYSDHIIITDDNPRTEDPQIIVDNILRGLLCPWAAEVERDRGAAIAHVIDCARPGDVVLIAGKGHEPYQIVGTEKIPFSDVERVRELLT